MGENDADVAAVLATFEQRPGILDELVAAVNGHKTLDPLPACATCPASLWYLDHELACFCKVRKDDTWGGRAAAVRACAEREALLAPPDSDEQPLR
ncbi:hypothetical protein [Sphingomonas baiyangensis]|uniref:Uncharacterized protein n=1 Tax=Sphingomonas baiyangensis TaxID=2572576 RepID=A0A4U1L1Y9_9SPHN|nr:hypothetical protein [Sphingomonas baiyangensis]TKD50602.1 hypothetical protein FBR43_07355 [Sphingomonas baiyangensis]